MLVLIHRLNRQRFLAFEMIVKGALEDPGGLGDVLDGGTLVAFGVKTGQSGGGKLVTNAGAGHGRDV